ncbi:hypothetical protein L218DRAFT_988330 [Marasmius fiardii PR-910]|nr:hypothetical protein L218DRAFT_988330 [Marasmius fiardii PR-910]
MHATTSVTSSFQDYGPPSEFSVAATVFNTVTERGSEVFTTVDLKVGDMIFVERAGRQIFTTTLQLRNFTKRFWHKKRKRLPEESKAAFCNSHKQDGSGPLMGICWDELLCARIGLGGWGGIGIDFVVHGASQTSGEVYKAIGDARNALTYLRKAEASKRTGSGERSPFRPL